MKCKSIVQHTVSGSIDNSTTARTYYVRDAQGNVLAVYEQKLQGNTMSIKQAETHIYGTQRLGISYPSIEMIGNSGLHTDSTKYYYGHKDYELTNHLGNVLATVSDRKIPVDKDNDAIIDNYVADITSVSDYYPFGSPLYGRRWSAGYRYGFNGKENDNEIMGNGNFQDYGARMYDTRLGRFISADPIIVMQHKYQDLSPYQFASNTPIQAKDLDGLEAAYQKSNGAWVTAGDKLQRKITAEELQSIQNRFPPNASAPQSAGEKLVEGFINPFLIVSTSIVMPIINQAYTTVKEGLHPGAARDKKNQLDWAVPYKLDNWKIEPLKQNITDTFEGKEGYERGGKEVMDATIDVVWELPINARNIGQRIMKKGLEIMSGETYKRLIDASRDVNDNKNNKR